MDSRKVLNWLVKESENDAQRYYGPPYYPFDKDYKIEDLIFELRNRRAIPSELGAELKKIPKLRPQKPLDEGLFLQYLKKVFGNNVTLISLILNDLFPDIYFYYRVSKLEDEIFAGLKFLSDVAEEFQFPFSRIGKGKESLENYLILNNALHLFAERIWSLEEPQIIQKRLHYFLYQGVGNLFLEKNKYHSYWVMATRENYFKTLDEEDETVWSGRKEMQKGDLVFMYRQFPKKAITDMYSVSDSYFDPYGGWEGYWADLKKVTSLNDIKMSEMKRDEILNQWNFVKMQSQGTITEPVPHFIFNRLLEKIDENVIKKYSLKPEPVEKKGYSGHFSSEKEFEDKVIEPLLRRWGVRYHRQYPCEFVIGSQSHSCQIDFLVRDSKGLLTLFENKLRIVSEKDLQRATLQAKSYALQLGINNFVIASPEGFWIYSLKSANGIFIEKIDHENFNKNNEYLKNLIKRLR